MLISKIKGGVISPRIDLEKKESGEGSPLLHRRGKGGGGSTLLLTSILKGKKVEEGQPSSSYRPRRETGLLPALILKGEKVEEGRPSSAGRFRREKMWRRMVPPPLSAAQHAATNVKFLGVIFTPNDEEISLETFRDGTSNILR